MIILTCTLSMQRYKFSFVLFKLDPQINVFCFCVHNTKQTVFVHKAVVFNVFNIWILFKIHQLYYRVFFYHEVKCLCLCFLVWLFCTVLLFNIISHIHFYMSTHLVCICFDFFFSFCHVVETFFLLLLFRFFVVEKSFFFCNVLGNII